MRSARMLLAAATATAALAIAAPGAYAATLGDGDHDSSSSSTKERDDSSSSYSREHDKDSDHDKGSWHEKPNGGMHTGGGALTVVKTDDSFKGDKKFDPETYKDKESSGSDQEKGSWNSEQDGGSWDEQGRDEEEKPHGGMHTGGGALATPGVTAGGVAVLGLVAAGAYVMRRRNNEGGVA